MYTFIRHFCIGLIEHYQNGPVVVENRSEHNERCGTFPVAPSSTFASPNGNHEETRKLVSHVLNQSKNYIVGKKIQARQAFVMVKLS